MNWVEESKPTQLTTVQKTLQSLAQSLAQVEPRAPSPPGDSPHGSPRSESPVRGRRPSDTPASVPRRSSVGFDLPRDRTTTLTNSMHMTPTRPPSLQQFHQSKLKLLGE